MPMPSPTRPGSGHLYQTGLRTLDQQVSTIEGTRDRAGKLLTAATFAVSLFLLALQNYRTEIDNITMPGYIGGILAITGFLGVVVSTFERPSRSPSRTCHLDG